MIAKSADAQALDAQGEEHKRCGFWGGSDESEHRRVDCDLGVAGRERAAFDSQRRSESELEIRDVRAVHVGDAVIRLQVGRVVTECCATKTRSLPNFLENPSRGK